MFRLQGISAAVQGVVKKRPSFYHLHVFYFVSVALVGAVLFWSFGTKEGFTHSHFSFVDSFFTVVSGMCLSGLSSIPIEDIPPRSQVLVMVMMILGGPLFAWIVPLLVKKHRYRTIAMKVLRPQVQKKTTLLEFLSRTISLQSNEDMLMKSMACNRNLPEPFRAVFLEHQAICQLMNIVVWYLTIVHFLGFLVAWMALQFSPHDRSILESRAINQGFFALFATVSAFNNVGFVLTNENLTIFRTNTVLLLDLGLVILLGNTIFPAVLRGTLCLLQRYSSGAKKEAYTLLLENPRRFCTHLFPRTAALWLLLVNVSFHAFGVLAFCALEWKNKALEGLAIGEKIANGLFQSINTRSGGMNSVNLGELSQALLFVYCLMMYIKPYPVYLEAEQSREDDTTLLIQSKRNFANDNTILFFLVFFISISIRSQLKSDPLNFNLFAILFEVASAYGCVGLTLGYSCDLRLESGPCHATPLSFSGVWNAPGKVLMVAVMFTGRHRDLPFHVDSPVDIEKLSRLSRRPSFIALAQHPPVPESTVPPV